MTSPYRRVLGPDMDRLPPKVREIHDACIDRTWSGRASIVRGTGLASRMASALLGFPRAGPDVPVSVLFSVRDGTETWRRDFSGTILVSRQWQGTGAWDGLLVERFGPVRAGLALVVDGARLSLVVRRWSFLGIPMPLALAPCGETFETQDGERFRFDVEIRHPFTGLLVGYRGWLEPAADGAMPSGNVPETGR